MTLGIEKRFSRIPLDTTASIFTAGLLGEQYVGLDPGGDEAFLTDGDEIQLSQSALVLEQIIGQFLFSKAAEGSVKEDDPVNTNPGWDNEAQDPEGGALLDGLFDSQGR